MHLTQLLSDIEYGHNKSFLLVVCFLSLVQALSEQIRSHVLEGQRQIIIGELTNLSGIF